ncbi:MAG TPA: transposase [Candidatus Acidoferrum sp.]|jgi:putative transposase
MGRLTHRTGPGWTYFVTTNAYQGVAVFRVAEIAQIFVTKLYKYRQKGNYLLHEFVLMPNHLHLLLTPSSTTTLEKAMNLIKGGSSHEIHRIRKSESPIWQSGFHESRVTSATDYKKKVDYIHFNPVTAHLVGRSEGWPFSSANGKYELDPVPQGLKPVLDASRVVGPKDPTPTTNVRSVGA